MLKSAFSDISHIASGLAQHVSSRENEFLHMGEQLYGLADRIGMLSSNAQQLIEATSSGELTAVSHDLSSKLDFMQGLCGQDGKKQDAEVIASIQTALSELLSLVSNYSRIVRTLQMLGISTRIESARLGADGRGFTTLADDVEKLAHKIVEYSDNIKAHISALASQASEAEGRLASMDEMQSMCSLSLAESLRKHLELLEASEEHAKIFSAEITTIIDQISHSTGEVVSSVQFHDIVRQQVEHVEETLHESVALFSGDHGYVPSDVAGWMQTVVSLQADQLECGVDNFVSAVNVLEGELQAMSRLVGDVGQQVHAYVEQSGAHLAGDIRSSVESIAKHFTELAVMGEGMGSLMVAVAATVSEMSTFLDDIEDVGAEIELIALNASIKAAHTGDSGKALGVLATSIQHLSQDSAVQTMEIAKNLQNVSGSAAELREHADGYLDSSQAENMVQELQGLLERLETFINNNDALFDEIGHESDVLAEEFTGLVRSLEFHNDVSAALQASHAQMKELSQQCGDCCDCESTEGMPEQLQALLNRYTMDMEREVHHNVLSGGSFESGSDDIELFDGFEDGDDDNVELF